jgi:hypothetical protein
MAMNSNMLKFYKLKKIGKNMKNLESCKIKSPVLNGEYTPKLVIQKFIIIGTDFDNKNDYLKRTEAQAAFMYKEYMISMTTSGLNHGSCLTEISISKYIKDSLYTEIVSLCHTVEEAINWIDKNIKN